jgi:UDP-galactopyranose mutase
MSRSARERRVFFVEEPIFGATVPKLEISGRGCGVVVVVPYLPGGLNDDEVAAMEQSLLLDDLFLEYNISDYILWYYTPMALAFTWHLEPLLTVYDCMDELSAFKNAPRNLKRREAELLALADLVFTGGYSLYEAKCHLHPNIHPFPSSIDPAHFRKARKRLAEPEDQVGIPRPRLGFFGVIDERMDIDLLAGIADAKPDWSLVMIGPVVKIDPAELPRRQNIHYLGGRDYNDLPAYLSGWDIAMLPFARNESTRYISPTKTPEYLAAGIPTISTSIRDVAHPYGEQGLVEIVDTPAEFVAAAKRLMSSEFDYQTWLSQVDDTLAFSSWDSTWARMMRLIDLTMKNHYPDLFATELGATAAGRSPSFTNISPIPGD